MFYSRLLYLLVLCTVCVPGLLYRRSLVEGKTIFVRGCVARAYGRRNLYSIFFLLKIKPVKEELFYDVVGSPCDFARNGEEDILTCGVTWWRTSPSTQCGSSA